jgi:hypothetical protein
VTPGHAFVRKDRFVLQQAVGTAFGHGDGGLVPSFGGPDYAARVMPPSIRQVYQRHYLPFHCSDEGVHSLSKRSERSAILYRRCIRHFMQGSDMVAKFARAVGEPGGKTELGRVLMELAEGESA